VGLGTVVRVYQCQIVKKPVNAFVRTIEPAATLIRSIPLGERARYG
jgi:hypothetical protein